MYGANIERALPLPTLQLGDDLTAGHSSIVILKGSVNKLARVACVSAENLLYTNGRNRYIASESQSRGLDNALTRAVCGFTAEVVRAFENRNSSTELSGRAVGGALRSGCMGRGI